jgi:hypothetical protein
MIDPKTGQRIVIQKDAEGKPFIKASAEAMPKLIKALQKMAKDGVFKQEDIQITLYDENNQPVSIIDPLE